MGRRRRWWRWRRELPWLLGVVAGWSLLWLLGGAFVLEGPIEGYGWPGYLNNAWMVIHRQDIGYDTFRRPLHAALVGALGEGLGSYAQGAVLVSSAAMGLLVLSAGLAGRALGGPWAGMLAAATLPMVSHNADAARWANDYPLYAGLGGVSMAAALAAIRWPDHRLASGWVALCGVSGGLAIGVDDRGWIAALCGAGLLVLAGRPLWLVLAGAGLLLGPLTDALLWIPEAPRLAMTDKMEIQRGVVLRWAAGLRDPALDAACAAEARGVLPSVAGLLTPCSREMLRSNIEGVFPRHFPFGLALTAIAAPLVLLPGRQGWRGALRGAAWLALSLGSLLLQSLWVPQPDRYMLAWALPLATVVPVGMARLLGTLGARGPLLPGAAALALGLWAWRADPTERTVPSADQRNTHHIARQQAIAWIEPRLGPDDRLLDCSEMAISTALLPRMTGPLPPMLKLHSGDRCRQWATDAPPASAGEVYLVADPRRELRAHGGVEVILEAEWLRGLGWQALGEWDGVTIWRLRR